MIYLLYIFKSHELYSPELNFLYLWYLYILGYKTSELDANKLDGFDMWNTLSTKQEHSPRTESLYNIDRENHNHALRVNDMKIIIGQNYDGKYQGWLPLLKVR